jgi:flavin reductase (DIM6/NTAB) family NADH-FMN oxidoreductase RutF
MLRLSLSIIEEVSQMAKVTLGPQPLVYPMPAMLIGANVEGRANFMTAAWCGIVNGRPPMISVALQHHRYTLKGILETRTLSVNVASTEMVKETDYCGVVSGAKADKAKVCGFKISYGKLSTAPLIEQCPVNLECSVAQTINLGSHMLVIGQIEEVHVSDTCLTDGKPDVDKIKPFLWVFPPANEYREFGKAIGKAFHVGNQISTVR